MVEVSTSYNNNNLIVSYDDIQEYLQDSNSLFFFPLKLIPRRKKKGNPKTVLSASLLNLIQHFILFPAMLIFKDLKQDLKLWHKKYLK